MKTVTKWKNKKFDGQLGYSIIILAYSLFFAYFYWFLQCSKNKVVSSVDFSMFYPIVQRLQIFHVFASWSIANRVVSRSEKKHKWNQLPIFATIMHARIKPSNDRNSYFDLKQLNMKLIGRARVIKKNKLPKNPAEKLWKQWDYKNKNGEKHYCHD